ncbi:hypothetical protein [Bacillus sp. REN10]|uniref:hypothetical protein n=1 Tax=Bacillus sp. REN10 TaxID=2782541 RepID=UPI00193C2B11|nr:hypothetical protein [Bacillus sp. REN10]
MNLTYEITNNGYKILRDGVVWIIQEGYIPFSAQTMEESAQLHINDILANHNQPPTESLEDQIKQLQDENAVLTASLIDLKTQYTSVPCQYHQDYSVKIDKVLEGVEADGTV